MTPFAPLGRISDERCVSLIGIAGAGKTTLGKALAARLGWAHLDTDRLIEATLGQPLQAILDERGLTGFLAAEEAMVATLGVKRTVVSTGGSVVYSRKAVDRLKSLGPVVHLRIGLDDFLERVQGADGRAFVRPDGRSLADVFAEREPLYRQACDFSLDTSHADLDASVEQCAGLLAGLLAGD
ncbi:Shikimate kinase 1 [Fundidesulfovibrio magnetotacticus]|uniref:Shikimate kinase n=1 Tax=Fundidesulfovibrio magnetotacticus TaxID=2730080 RepID=A0A6V8LT54_9BACT|nr:homoserine kinase [Fundidesulfovibrio magnetotacticus]GFK93259.1 Shikimate kinase 1 [Fundidesulfovibrio magnetotacticus]